MNKSILFCMILMFGISYVSAHSDLCQNVIRNSGFQQNRCHFFFCVWKQDKYKDQISNWLPDQQIQVGLYTTYGVKPTTSNNGKWAIDLQPKKNSCIKQYIRTNPGKYKLQFDYALNLWASKKSTTFDVKINDNVIRSYQPTSTKMTTTKFLIQIKQQQTQLQFCSTGVQDTLGAILDNVRMYYLENCDASQI